MSANVNGKYTLTYPVPYVDPRESTITTSIDPKRSNSNINNNQSDNHSIANNHLEQNSKKISSQFLNLISQNNTDAPAPNKSSSLANKSIT